MDRHIGFLLTGEEISEESRRVLEPAPEAVHLLAEAGRLAFADRALYVADADFVPVPVAGLVAPNYLAERAALIGERSMGIAKPGVPAGIQVAYAPDRSPLRISTSHVVAVDDQGGIACFQRLQGAEDLRDGDSAR